MAAGITDPRNLGALLRSAECAGVTGVVLPRHRSARLSPTVTKTAAGAIEHLPFAVVGGVPAALSELRDLGVWSIGLAGEADQSLYDLPLGDGPVALVVGSEEKGLAPLVRRRCDAVAAIPQHGTLPVAQRRRGRRGRLLRGGPPTRRPRRPVRRRPPTSDVQKAQRRAATGMSLRHSGHSRVSGLGSSVGSRLRRRISAVSGTTTAKKTTVATMRNDSSALRNDPYLNCRVVHREGQVGEVGLAEDGGDERRDRVGHERGDHGREGDADDDRDRQVDDVAPQDELLEIRQHPGLPARDRLDAPRICCLHLYPFPSVGCTWRTAAATPAASRTAAGDERDRDREPEAGIEPATSSLQVKCSTN